MPNSLLSTSPLPQFNQIQLAHFQPAIQKIIADFNSQLELSIANSKHTFKEVVSPLSELASKLDYVWSIFSHLKNVTDSDELRAEFDVLSSVVTGFYTGLGQNRDLFEAYKSVAEHDIDLSEAQSKMLELQLRGFRLNGVELEDSNKARFAEIKQTMVSLNNTFSENVLDATQSWQLHLEDLEKLDGLPAAVLDMLHEKAKTKGYDGGFLLTLDIPSYLPVMQYVKNRALREQLYTAYITRASDQGPQAGAHDNSALMLEILSLRKELAGLLGFETYAELSIETKMAESTDQVLGFLKELADKSRNLAMDELAELAEYARDQLDIEKLEAWDLAFVAETFRNEKYNVDQEALRAYFPLPRVLKGLFELVGTLFDVQVKASNEMDVPHKDTQVFVLEQQGEEIAHIYMDLYAREGKRGGAWVSPCQKRSRSCRGNIIKPMAFLVCNFSEPTSTKPSMLTHNEMITLFHEFGHALHHCLTEIEQPEVSGISGVPWDAVELPSQFLENWCWEPSVLRSLSSHIETKEALPDTLINGMMAAKHFQAAMQTIRQLEFALFDFRLHHEFDGATDIMATLREVQDAISVMPSPEFARFPHGFSHIFAGGYSAGYYSYKWTEVLAADAFSAFEEEGVMNPNVGARFRREILSQGGARDVNEMFVRFRGRMPKPDALLQKLGV